MKKSKVCLIIIFNHRYDNNIEKLRQIYKKRFSYIRFLVPFYDGKKEEDIISVYDSSYNFHGFIAQAKDMVYDEQFEHYFYVGDDVVINPVINEHNYAEYFGINKNTNLSFGMDNLVDTRLPLRCYINVLDAFTYFWSGVNYAGEIPDKETAIIRMQKNSEKYGKTHVIRKNALNRRWKENRLFFFRRPKIGMRIVRGRLDLPYPIMTGFSDIFIVNKSSYMEFCHMLGVLAAMNLQVELSIPTALAIVSEELKIHENRNNVPHGVEEKYINKYDGNYMELMQSWSGDCDFLHPIKLSKWKTREYEAH